MAVPLRKYNPSIISPLVDWTDNFNHFFNLTPALDKGSGKTLEPVTGVPMTSPKCGSLFFSYSSSFLLSKPKDHNCIIIFNNLSDICSIKSSYIRTPSQLWMRMVWKWLAKLCYHNNSLHIFIPYLLVSFLVTNVEYFHLLVSCAHEQNFGQDTGDLRQSISRHLSKPNFVT